MSKQLTQVFHNGKPCNTRNVTVIAHVDHGKTTLSDSLLAHNNIISERMAGKLRFLDSRQDEQLRGITMEAHAIALQYQSTFLINLIDSPGHVDFSADVSSAVRLCDGAMLVVDLVEGVCVQTHAVGRVAWEEGLAFVLVLNKVDRLILELKLTINEACAHVHRVLEQCNAMVSGFIRKDFGGRSEEELDGLERLYLFEPRKGNVVFASGTDSWGFTIRDFAKMLAGKIGVEEDVLVQGMWGMDQFWDSKDKRVVEDSSASSDANCMFAEFVLKNVFAVYDVVLADPPKPKKLQNVLEALGLSRCLTQAQSKDKKHAIRSVMSQWLPLSTALMDMIVKCVPDPKTAQSTRRCNTLLPPSSVLAKDEAYRLVQACDPSSEHLVAFISKIIAIPKNAVPMNWQTSAAGATNEDEDANSAFIALGRVFSGTLKSKQALVVVGPKNTIDHVKPNTVRPFLMMGGDLLALNDQDEDPVDIPAGCIFALFGLGSTVLKTATLYGGDSYVGQTDAQLKSRCISLLKMPAQSAPLLRVSIEPIDPKNWEFLSKGLKRLNRADPVLEVRISPNGEHIISAIGELHLERCLKDLKDVFARGVEFKCSEPLAAFRETLSWKLHAASSASKLLIEPSLISVLQHCEESNTFVGPQGQVWVRGTKRVFVRAVPLLHFGEDELMSSESLKLVQDLDETGTTKAKFYDDAKLKLQTVSLSGGNVLLFPINYSEAFFAAFQEFAVSGFNLACRAGPLCEEPVRGVAFIVECESELSQAGYVEDVNAATSTTTSADVVLTSSFADAFRRTMRAFEWITNTSVIPISAVSGGATVKPVNPLFGLRLMEAVFSCSLHCLAEGEQLGNMYSVVAKRRGKVVSEGMVEGTSIFQIEALIPVVECYGIADELRKKTSGNASSPQLVFSHWELIHDDPFFQNTTLGELEDSGETVDADRNKNLAYKLVLDVRKRKGLPTGEKVVQHGEKQRNLSRKR